MHTRFLALLALLLPMLGAPALVPAPAAAGPGGGDDGGAVAIGAGGLSLGSHESTVTASLIADVTRIAPGEPFVVGLEIRMDPGWHTYWENGGDAGLPTSIEWTLPEGFEAGPIRWPVPHRYEEDGDLVTFGYADRVVLLTEITPPARLGAEGVRLAARVDWLQCKDICIPGGADLDLRLDVGASPAPAPDAVVERIRATQAQVPVRAAEVPGLGVVAYQERTALPVGSEARVAVVFPGLGKADAANAEFYPRTSDTLWMRDGTFRTDGGAMALLVPVEVDSAVEPGSVQMLSGVLRVPRGGEELLLSFAVPVTIAAAGDPGEPTNAPVFSGGPLLPPDGPAGTGTAGDASAPIGGVALLRFLLFAFLGGVILNVMPCVLPVISLKILGFVSKAEEDPGKVARLGWVFAAGVVLSFLVLAAFVIGLKSAGEHIGWGFQFQNPVFVGGLAVVVFVFSLSLLGVFEVGATTAMLGMGLAAKERKDYADAFFHGILTTILATPCTAPMLGAAIAFAFSQPAPIILLVFFTVSLGLAAPYVLLSLNPGWLKYLPRPGAWMERFKQGMGFLLLATLVWLLFVFGAQTGTDTLTWMLAFLLVLGFFAWVHGTFLNLSSSPARSAFVWALTIAGIAFSYHSFLHDRLFGEEAALAAAAGDSVDAEVEVTDGGIRWEPFSVAYLEEQVAAGRTVFLDFTADWCWTCKVNEKTVLADAEVERVFAENDVLTLKGDWTRKDPEITEVLRRHDRAGVPFYVVYPAGRLSDAIVLPEVINKKLVIESLRRAGPSTSGPGV